MSIIAPKAKRIRRTNAQVEILEGQIMAVLTEGHPQSVRHVFYRMTDPRLAEPVEKSEKGYRDVQRRILEMRESGKLPYGWITDSIRSGYFTYTYNSAAEYLRTMQSGYRQNLWANTPYHCEV